MNSLFDLDGKIAVVTGGYGHLGSAITSILNYYGATVIVAGRSIEKFNDRFGGTTKSGIHFSKLDINDTNQFKNSFSEVNNTFGSIDILINNAHSAKGNSQYEMADDDWNYTMEGVLGSVHRGIREVLPIMKKQGKGKIVNITSMYGLVSPDFKLYSGDDCEKYTNPPHYGAAKAGIIQLTKYYAVLLGGHNIQVNAIAPGPFPKEHIQKENPEFIKRLSNKNPLKRIGKPEDIQGCVALLSSNASDFITGQTIQVDGGWTIW